MTRHWLEIVNLWLEVTRPFLWLDSDSTRPSHDSTLTKQNFRWLWLDSDSKGLWLWLDKFDSGTSLLVTKYYQQHFSQHRRQAKCTAVPLQIVELSHSRATWLLVDTKSKTPLLNHQNRIETTVSTHTHKRQHKRLRIASVSSNIFEAVVANKA